jgi:hypothetical protein
VIITTLARFIHLGGGLFCSVVPRFSPRCSRAPQRKKEEAKMSYDEYMKAKAAEAAEAKLEARAAEAFDMKGLKAAVKEEVAVSSSHTAFNIVPTRPLRRHCASPCRARAAQTGRSSSSLILT